MNIYLSVFLFPLLFGFMQEKTKIDFIQIPIAKSMSNLSEVRCSQFIDYFEYIPLETDSRCMVGDEFKAIILKEKILIYKSSFCYVFDRKTGKFLYEMSKRGRGPGEYQYSLQAYDPMNAIIYSGGWNNNLMMFSVDGKYISSFPIPNQKGGLEEPSLIYKFHSFPNSMIIGYSTNMLGTEKKLLTIFNQKGEITKMYPNKNVTEKHPLKNLNLLEAQFYTYNNETFFKELYNDTVFLVTEKALIPHIAFQLGKNTVPYEVKWDFNGGLDNPNYIFTYKILENKFWVCMKFLKDNTNYLSLYNKDSNKLDVTTLFRNDIDNFLPFIPDYLDPDGNFVQIVEPLDVKRWFDSHPSNISKNIKQFQTVDIVSNPIIVIGILRSK